MSAPQLRHFVRLGSFIVWQLLHCFIGGGAAGAGRAQGAAGARGSSYADLTLPLQDHARAVQSLGQLDEHLWRGVARALLDLADETGRYTAAPRQLGPGEAGPFPCVGDCFGFVVKGLLWPPSTGTCHA